MKYDCIATYIMASHRNGTLYVGVTSDLLRRVYEHKTNAADGFTKKYAVHDLVYFELHESMEAAIHHEKRLKKYTRRAKMVLIEKDNANWNDLYETTIQ